MSDIAPIFGGQNGYVKEDLRETPVGSCNPSLGISRRVIVINGLAGGVRLWIIATNTNRGNIRA